MLIFGSAIGALIVGPYISGPMFDQKLGNTTCDRK